MSKHDSPWNIDGSLKPNGKTPRNNGWQSEEKSWPTGLPTVDVLLLVVVVGCVLLLLPACAPMNHTHPIVQPQPYRPPQSLMVPAPTQYLLEPSLQRSAPKPQAN